MYYVYILQSEKDKSCYVGSTEDLRNRIKEHNAGRVKYTSSKMPYRLLWYCAFKNKIKALHFEQYLKHGSGFAFSRKRLI